MMALQTDFSRKLQPTPSSQPPFAKGWFLSLSL